MDIVNAYMAFDGCYNSKGLYTDDAISKRPLEGCRKFL